MAYIFVYTNSYYEGLTGVGFSENPQKEIDGLNKDPNVLGDFTCVYQYEVNDWSDYNRFINMLLGVSPTAGVKKQNGEMTSYFNISVDGVINALDNFIVQRSGGNETKSTFASSSETSTSQKENESSLSREANLSKEEIIDYLISLGCNVHKSNCTYASIKKKKKYFWLLPHVGIISSDWSIILDDKPSKKYYFFDIPFGSIKKKDLVTRSEMPGRLDISIKHSGLSFVDMRSGYDFTKFKVAEISYPSNNSIGEKVIENFSSQVASTDNKAHVKKHYEDNTIHSDRHVSLAHIGEVRYGKPYKFELLGIQYDVEYWRDILSTTLEALYINYPSVIERLAEKNAMPEENCKRVYITKNKNLFGGRENRKLHYADIYFLVNLSSDLIIDFLKFLLRQCAIDLDSFIIWYK